MSVYVQARGIRELERFFADLEPIAEQAMAITINSVAARQVLPEVRDRVSSQVNYPTGYVQSRIRLSSKATRARLRATISGRDRATSLARFAPGQTAQTSKNRGVVVEVKKGNRQLLRKGFIINLRNGNRGLAVRVGNGETLSNSQRAVRLENNVYLLYGPSVDQVARGVYDEVTPFIEDQIVREFLRQFSRLSRG